MTTTALQPLLGTYDALDADSIPQRALDAVASSATQVVRDVLTDAEPRALVEAVLALTPGVAKGEAVLVLCDHGDEVRWAVAASDVALPEGVDAPAAEAHTVAMVRELWPTILGLEPAPEQLGFASESAFDAAWDDLASGRLDPVTQGWDEPVLRGRRYVAPSPAVTDGDLEALLAADG